MIALSAPAESKWLWRIIAALLILGSGAAHLRYLAHDCPLDLAPDEAHYWQWSRHLDASYYSKGPLVAWLIRASCELLGDNVLAVRLPAVICGSLLLVSFYVLTAQAFGREHLSALVVGAALTMPVFSAGRTVMTIDAPYACCWGWALVLGHAALVRGSRWAWLPLGLIIGLGILAKYTMLLWLPSAFLFLLISRPLRTPWREPRFWLGCGIALLCCLPIIWWNMRHDWVTLRHLSGQASLSESVSQHAIRWTGPLEFLAGQLGMLMGYWFIVWACSAVAQRPGRAVDPSRRYLWCMSAPMVLFFALFSLRTPVLPNWPITAYCSGLILATPWLARQLADGRSWKRALFLVPTGAALLFGLVTTLIAHDTAPARPLLVAMAGPPTPADPQPLRRFDPTCRMRGWHYLAGHVDQIREELRANGTEPVPAASRWTLASELAFYCEGRPMVYSLGSALWDRQSQFDLWRPNPIHDPEQFRGQTFIFVDVGGLPPEMQAAFESIERRPTVHYEEDGCPIAFWDIAICRGFRGFAKAPNRQY
jgi:4-amino-4-deoxy-L-arabinose transferase-like glycosyltransferase